MVERKLIAIKEIGKRVFFELKLAFQQYQNKIIKQLTQVSSLDKRFILDSYLSSELFGKVVVENEHLILGTLEFPS